MGKSSPGDDDAGFLRYRTSAEAPMPPELIPIGLLLARIYPSHDSTRSDS
jgi:hypothetical protein